MLHPPFGAFASICTGFKVPVTLGNVGKGNFQTDAIVRKGATQNVVLALERVRQTIFLPGSMCFFGDRLESKVDLTGVLFAGGLLLDLFPHYFKPAGR